MKKKKSKIKKIIAAKLAAIAPWILIPLLLVAVVAGVIDELGADSVSGYSGRAISAESSVTGSETVEEYVDSEGNTVVVPPGTSDPIEYLAMHDALPEMTDEEKRLSYLEEVSITDMVKAGMEPFTDDIDNVYKGKSATVTVEHIQTVKTMPSKAKQKQKRQELINDKIGELEKAREERIKAEEEAKKKAEEEEAKKKAEEDAKKASASPSPTGSGGKTGKTGGKNNGGKTGVTPVPAPTEGAKAKSSASSGDPSMPKASPTGKAKNTSTPKLTSTPNPTPSVSPTKTPKGTPKPTPEPTPTATPTPLPPITEADFMPCDWEDIDRGFGAWMDAWEKDKKNTEDVSVYVTFSFSPYDLVAWMNDELHTPWQATYGFSTMLQQHNEDAIGTGKNDLNITQVAIDATSEYFNSDLAYALQINYWGEKYDGQTIKYDERESKLTYKRGSTSIKNYTEWDKKYAEADYIAIEDDDPDTDKWITAERGFEPVLLLKSTDDWSHHKVYGEMTGTKNSYGFYEQKVTTSTPSSPFNEFVCGYDFSELDLEMIGNTIEALPYSSLVVCDYEDVVSYIQGTGIYAGSTGSGAIYNPNDITWLVGDSDAENACRSAISKMGSIYSQKQRYSKGYFDCSSLVYTLYGKELGYDIGLMTSDGLGTTAANECEKCDLLNWTISHRYDESIMQPGDIIFWRKAVDNKRYLRIYHTGIYMGNGIIIDASSSYGRVVCREMWGKDQVIRVARPCQGLELPSLGMSPDDEAEEAPEPSEKDSKNKDKKD